MVAAMNIQAVKYSTRIEDFVANRYRVTLKRKSSSIYVGLCPLHSESTPSFHVYSNSQKYHCFGCGAHGDIFDLIQAKESISFSEATKILDTGCTEVSKEAIRQQKEQQIKEESSRLIKQQEVAKKAALKWRGAPPLLTRESLYLHDKNVEPVEGIRKHNGDENIIIPMVDCSSRIWNLQTIIYEEDDNTYKKLFMSGGRTKGLFFPMGGQFTQKNKVIIAEGIATALTIYQKTGGAFKVLCAFNASNIVNVAKEVRARRPNYQIVIAADNDRSKIDEDGELVEKDPKDNVGLIKANEAAKRYCCQVVYPEFGDIKGCVDADSDFNDWYEKYYYPSRDAKKFIKIFN